MSNPYMEGHNLHGIGFAAATQNAVDETAANYQAHIDKLERKLSLMMRSLDEAYNQRDAWKETCRHFAGKAPRETVLAVYDSKKSEVKQGHR